jgi:cytochrome c556
MNSAFKIITLSCAVAIGGTLALAQATPEELTAAVEARHAHMKAMGGAIGTLAKMAQGEVAYDAAAATEAANALLAAAAEDQSGYWLAGSENGAVADSRARAEIWTNMDDFMARHAALATAAEAMVVAAGTDLASLQAALPAIGGSCGGCHEVYRTPES